MPHTFMLLALCCLGASAGCAGQSIPTYPPLEPEQAMHVLAQRAQAIRSVSSQALLVLRSPDGSSLRLDAAVVMQWPGCVRLRAWKFGSAVFDLTLTPQGLWIVAPQEPRQREQILGAGPQTAHLMRQWMLLTAGAFDQPQLVEQPQILQITENHADATKLVCQIDRSTLTPRHYALCDAQGVERFTLDLRDYVAIGGVVWPQWIRAQSDSGIIELQLRDVEINGEIPVGAFIPPARAEKLP